jgi:hypothetical protein
MHNIMKKIVQLCAILSLFLASCSTQRIAILQPQIPTQYVDREGFATQKSDSLDVTFGYLFSTKDHFVFEVSVKNKSADSVLIEPQDFSFQTASNVDSTLLSTPFKAQSFTEITHTWDERVRQRNIKTAVVVLAVVAAVIAIDHSTNKTFNRNDYSYSFNTGVDLSYNFFDAMIYNHLSKKEAKRGLEKSYMFPRKIGKSETHIGAVYFPRFDNAQQLLFNFKIGNNDFKTLFKQSIQTR